MTIVKGLLHKQHPMDSPMKCVNGCQRMFYVPHYVNGEWVECPHCKKLY